jgi:hypothetical protein
MALPVIDKTWDYVSQNLAYSTVLTTNKTDLLFIKNQFIAGSGAWTVVQSSDGSAAGVGDKWTDISKIVFVAAAPTVHSWIVLRQAGMGLGQFEICIDCVGNVNGSILTLATSWNATFGSLAAGTTANRPTSADEYAVSFTWSITGSVGSTATHVFKTSDGSCTRILRSWSNNTQNIWMIETPKNPKSWWTTPYIFGILIPDYGRWADTACYARIDGTNCLMRFTCPCVNNLPLSNIPHFQAPDANGEWFVFPIGLISLETTRKGRMGELQDIWWCPTNWPIMYLPASPKAYAVFNDVMVAWKLGSPIIIGT